MLTNIIWDLLAVVAVVALPIGLNFARQLTGIQLDAKHREALHAALLSGVEAAARQGVEKAPEAMAKAAIAHARESVPDALKRFGPTDDVLRNIALSKANEALDGIAGRFGP